MFVSVTQLVSPHVSLHISLYVSLCLSAGDREPEEDGERAGRRLFLRGHDGARTAQGNGATQRRRPVPLHRQVSVTSRHYVMTSRVNRASSRERFGRFAQSMSTCFKNEISGTDTSHTLSELIWFCVPQVVWLGHSMCTKLKPAKSVFWKCLASRCPDRVDRPWGQWDRTVPTRMWPLTHPK